MNREFVLRDNEVAINRPDGTVIIMNLNALRELQGEPDKDKEIADLRKKLSEANVCIERYKKANEDVEKAANDYLENYLEKIKDLKAQTEVLRNELDSVLKERDEFYNENDRLTKEVCNKNAEIQKMQQNLQPYKQQMVLFGPTSLQFPVTPDEMPDHVYIAHTGEVFFSQRDVEKAYNLAKGSVSAYFNDKQTALYARDPYGNRITDKQTGKDVTIGLVRRNAQMIFKNRDVNRPNFENYKLAIECAKDFVL